MSTHPACTECVDLGYCVSGFDPCPGVTVSSKNCTDCGAVMNAENVENRCLECREL